MSRLIDNSFDVDDDMVADMQKRRMKLYANPKVKAMLARFLTHLDAMEPKVIIRDRFMRCRDGALCAVGAFVASTGASAQDLRGIEKMSRFQRMASLWESGGDSATEDPGEEATVWAGEHAGLPLDLAYHFAWLNDEAWTKVETGWTTLIGGGRSMTHRDMTDEERWIRLRAFVAAKVGA